MIVLDTNLLSEVLLPAPAERILDWLATIPPRDLCTTAITQAELLLGVILLPPGRRRLFLSAEIDRMFGETFPDGYSILIRLPRVSLLKSK